MSNILSQIGTAVKGKIDGVNASISAEATARATAIAAEATTARAAESTNATAISDEESRATAAESTLTSNLASEASTARAAESTNATAISDEATRAAAAEGVLTTAVSDEATARAAADTSEASTRAAADTTNATAISDEETRATAAEGVLTTAVSSEATSRASADSALQGEIDAEEVRAAAAEGVLTSNLASEVTDRQTAVSAEATTRAAAVTNLDNVKANLAGAAFTGAVSGTDLTLSGNLTVTGTTTSIETVNSQVKDSLMLLNDGAAGSANNANDVGLIMERGSSDDGNVALVYDEGEDKFCMYKTSAAADEVDITDADSSASLLPVKVSDVYVGSDNLGALADFTLALG